MRILKIISSLGYGGAETQAINLSKALVAEGHEVLLVSLSQDIPRVKLIEGTGVELYVEAKQRKVDLRVIKSLRNKILEWQPDIVHAYLYDAEFYARLATIGLDVPLINSERNDNYKLNVNQVIGDFLTIKRVDGVIANSFAGKVFAEKRYKHLNRNRISVVWNGIDLKQVLGKLRASNKNLKLELFGRSDIDLACMVAAIKPQKNYILALSVAERLIKSSDNWRVIFLGDKVTVDADQYKSQVFEFYSHLPNKDKIIFLGNRTDVVEILSQSDVSFLTSDHEGFPNAVLESMAVGTPAVTTDFSDIKKILPRGWMIQDDANPEQFVNAMSRVRQERLALSQESQDWVKDNCALDVVARKLADVYSTFLQ